MSPLESLLVSIGYPMYSMLLSESPSYLASIVSVIFSPAVIVTFALRSPVSLQMRSPPIRISGPLVSSMIGTSSPPGAARRFLRRRWNSSTVACEKLTRITSMPAETQPASGVASSDAGPMVATIFVSFGTALLHRRVCAESATGPRVWQSLLVSG